MNSEGSAIEDAASILDTVPEGYIRLDGEFRFTFINRAAEILFRADRADLIGKTPWDVHPESAGTPLEEGIRRAKAENVIVPFENYYEPWKRSYTLTAIPDSSGGVVVHFLDNTKNKQDITERKRAEARLQAHNERFQRIIENTDAGYFRIGMDGCYEDVNPAWLRMHGFTRKEDAIGLHYSAVQVPANVAEAQTIVQALIQGECVKAGEFSRLRRDGTIGYHSFSANPVLDGNRTIAIEGFLVDISERKAAEREKQHTEERYRALFDSMHEGVALHKLVRSNGIPEDYVLLDVNRRYEEIVGVKHQHVVNKSATEVYGTRSALYLKEYAAAVQSRSPFQFETYFPPMDKHFVISVAPLGDDLFATIFFDITEQRSIEEHYKLISENAADVIWLWDLAENRFAYVSPSVRQLTGFSPEEVMAQSMDQTVPPDTYRRIIAQTAERIAAVESGDETARIRTNEVECIRRDGSRVPVERVTTLISDDRGKVRQVLGVSRDITKRRRMQDALRKTEEKFSIAFQTSPAAITIVDLATGSYLEANQTFEQITGYQRDEIVGRSWDAVGLWSDPSNRDEAVRHLQTSGSLRNWEFTFRKKNGDMGKGLISAELIEIDGTLCAITASIDITERLQLESQLRQAQKLESIGRLAGGVAHDFNNLLTVISGYAEFLLQGIGPTDPLRPNLEEITSAAARATSLTRQLLAFSRKQLISSKVMDLNSTIKESVPMLQRLITEDIALTTKCDPALGQVMADPEQIHQVIMNLVVNARDAMPDGGKLEITTLNVDIAEENIGIYPDSKPGRYVMMVVTDTGEGMDEQTREHIFEPFFTTKEIGKGTGLGLATVYGVIRQSGGWADVSSELGIGTSVKVYLPRIDGRAPEEKLEISGKNEFIGSETILLVEDQDAVRRLAIAILKRYGYQILEAANGDQALDVAKEYPGEIHLLLTDVVLPGINGKELSERLKRVRPELKVLFTSGYSSDVITHRGVLDYGVAYIPKPFNPEKLAAKVREILAEPPTSQ